MVLQRKVFSISAHCARYTGALQELKEIYKPQKGKTLAQLRAKVEEVRARRTGAIEKAGEGGQELPLSVYLARGFSQAYLDAHGTSRKDPATGETLITLMISEKSLRTQTEDFKESSTKANGKALQPPKSPKSSKPPKAAGPSKVSAAQMAEMMASMQQMFAGRPQPPPPPRGASAGASTGSGTA